MKPYHSIILFIAIVCCSVGASINRYRAAEDFIVADMNQALEKTLAEKQGAWLTPDTISDYRSHLRIDALRQSSMIYYAVNEDGNRLRSKSMRYRDGNVELSYQGYANCSMATVFALSDQRLPLSLSLAAMLWAAFSVIFFRKSAAYRRCANAIGGMAYDENRRCFVTMGNEVVTLTPMQERLMEMFFNADAHRLSKQEICDALWPKKPDASDTLYTLIRRIRPVIADMGLTITTKRGKDYELTVKK